MPAATASRIKRQEQEKSNLHAEEYFKHIPQGLSLDPGLKKLLT